MIYDKPPNVTGCADCASCGSMDTKIDTEALMEDDIDNSIVCHDCGEATGGVGRKYSRQVREQRP